MIRRWKWNNIRPRIFNVAQRWYNVSARHWNNVKTTLHNFGTTLIQCCFNLASTLVKAILNPIKLVMIVDCEIVEYMLNTWIVFILLNEIIFFYYILTIQLLLKYQKIFWQWYILWYTMLVTMVTYREACNFELKTSKPLWKI